MFSIQMSFKMATIFNCFCTAIWIPDKVRYYQEIFFSKESGIQVSGCWIITVFDRLKKNLTKETRICHPLCHLWSWICFAKSWAGSNTSLPTKFRRSPGWVWCRRWTWEFRRRSILCWMSPGPLGSASVERKCENNLAIVRINRRLSRSWQLGGLVPVSWLGVPPRFKAR